MLNFLLLLFLNILIVSLNAETFAVLVSGSNEWENYRHQADVCHAYQILIENGIPSQNIITMMYDDIANHVRNPFPGKIFNTKQLTDVYQQVKIDYKENEVTVDNFQKIMLGIPTNTGSGRVLKTTDKDNIFVFFSDHGNTGFVGFPNHQTLTAFTLHSMLTSMVSQKKFQNLLIFIEACFSGSLFRGILKNDKKIYAVTAANGFETSYGSTDSINDNFGDRTVLGDAFSVNWMDFVEQEDLTQVTIDEQVEFVRKFTQLSHVQHFGDQRIGKMIVGDFLGIKKGHPRQLGPMMANTARSGHSSCIHAEKILMERLNKTSDPIERKKLERQIEDTLKTKRRIGDVSMDLYMKFVPHLRVLAPTKDPRIPPKQITQLRCHHEVVSRLTRACPGIMKSDHKNNFVATLATLCEEMVPSIEIVKQMRAVCF